MKVANSRTTGFDCVSVTCDPSRRTTYVLYHHLFDEYAVFNTLLSAPEQCIDPYFHVSALYRSHHQHIEVYRNTIDCTILGIERQTGFGNPGRLDRGRRPSMDEYPALDDPKRTIQELGYCQTDIAIIGHVGRCCLDCGEWLIQAIDASLLDGQLSHDVGQNSSSSSQHQDQQLSEYLKATQRMVRQDVEYVRRRTAMLLSQVQQMSDRTQSQTSYMLSVITQSDAEYTAAIAIDGKRDSIAMRTISILGIVYLPATFVATLFSMDIFSWPGTSNKSNETSSLVASPNADYQFYRTGLDSYGQPRKTESNFNRLSGVFCHRGLYDRAMKVSENTELAIDKGLGLGLRLHELDVRSHTRADRSNNPRKAFLAHDATGARVTAIARRWSQADGVDFIGTIVVERGVNLETNNHASSYQETMARIPGLAKLLSNYDPSYPWKEKHDGVALWEFFENSTFQLDLRDKDFAPMLAWLRYRHFFNLDVILKGYNYCYSDGQALLDAVNSFGTTDNGTLIEVLEGHEDAVTSVASNYRSMQIASGSHDSTVRIWEADTGKLIRTLTGHEKPVTSVVFPGNIECKWVVSGSCDKTIRIWDAETGAPIRTLRGHEEAVTSVAFSDYRKWIVSGSDDKTARIWDAQTGQLLLKLDHWEPVTSVAFSNDDMLVASGSHENTVRVWAAESGRLYHILRGHTGPVTSVAFSGDCTQIASGSHDNTVRIWAVNPGKPLYTLDGHTNKSTRLCSRTTACSWHRARMMKQFEFGKPTQENRITCFKAIRNRSPRSPSGTGEGTGRYSRLRATE
ncbi:hypothetical protein PENSUB_6808 [Penicillium subrubescens]|uniref:Uncharacterized protein n=1 Tax=Penicillium subrubescens TaxID=1316194 RepID=A0A1Q5TUC0_9EURO|nr:hypothetical protein PENSUB_6808 [Penicillium subrubescens]